MSKFRTIAITASVTAAICIPLGVFAGPLRNHPHLEKAHHALHEAWDEVNASQKSNEHVWKDEGGHGKEAKEAIDRAIHEIDAAAEWVNHHEK
jgi:hypothetical protein